ncbi:MarR family transcriptional regulator [Streptomyces sp. NPDC007205]|uniref:MarR family winged helix-turn-helix transcriptional regulator n=1 Tax=Streptomyces sp. NPDC007205 TaxID=3154316 RepID=UPI0033EC7017
MDPRQRIGYLAWQLRLATSHRAENLLTPLKLTLTQHSILLFLALEPDLSSAELARRAAVSRPSLSKALGELEARDLVRRRPHPSHGRVALLRLTPDGLRLAEDSQRRLDLIEAEAFAGLSEEERRQLCLLLSRVVERFAAR